MFYRIGSDGHLARSNTSATERAFIPKLLRLGLPMDYLDIVSV